MLRAFIFLCSAVAFQTYTYAPISPYFCINTVCSSTSFDTIVIVSTQYCSSNALPIFFIPILLSIHSSPAPAITMGALTST
ncbi:hypothetical protein KCU83_g5782, partial [Aureobasidium melanogenum]